MDRSSIIDVIEQIVHPKAENAPNILEELHLATLPSVSEIHDDIERKLLLPPRNLPSHWLPSYQVFGGFYHRFR